MSFLNYSFSRFTVGRVATVVCFLAVSCACASATPVTFTGEDLNAGPGNAHPTSAAAAASFDAAAAALGISSTITFEGAPLGSFTSLNAASGVTVTGTDLNGASQTVQNSPSFPPVPALGGFNTTSGGSEYVNILGGTLTFTFATPTQFFGAYLSGIQTAFFQDNFTFSDGSTETINAPGTGTNNSNGALDFVGFTDAGKSITSVTIVAGDQNGADEIGIDDVRYQSTSPVPEPGSLTLVFSGFAGLGMGYRRFRASRA